MTKKSILLSFLIIGTIIGAGFSSGKEIYIFFVRYGIVGLFLPIFCFVGFVLFFLYCFKLSNKIHAEKNFYFELYGNKYKYFEYIILIFSFIILSSMFSGCYSLSKFFLNTSFDIIIPLFLAIITYIITINGIGGASVTNLILIPISLLIIVSITILSIKNTSFGINISKIDNVILSIPTTFNYVFSNIFTIGLILIKTGKQYTKKELKFASISSSLVLTAVIFLLTLAISSFGDLAIITDMPILVVALSIGKLWYISMILIIGICLFTTALSSAILIRNKFKSNFKYFLVIMISYLFSFVGYDIFVRYFYQIQGLLSFVLYFFIYYYNSIKHNYRINARKKI